MVEHHITGCDFNPDGIDVCDGGVIHDGVGLGVHHVCDVDEFFEADTM